uniref:Conopressin-M2 n=1 Tax=Conus miliaris TaxID=97181 RepID=CONO2_CONML|nr:RecName: Full=Conopressin-M2 [Conus miliaris]
CFLGNCPDS